MYKSSKRIKLEKEIFSKSIKDIERMFKFSYDEDEDVKRKLPSNNSSPSNDSNPSAQFYRLDLPAGTGLQETTFDYDCVNLSFMLSDTQSVYKECEPVKPPILPSSSLIPGQLPNISVENLPRTVLLDLNEDDDMEDFKFELDLKSYLPRVNLENDLNMIDQMFMRPLQFLRSAL
ncbi:CIC11C00000003132 [Sungouiella intermedia]|uniref:CIC11C00000003132 n=1 Tax=Sungouiella intermedia TaxID=45354 RepID=A0A1L0C2M8_9ASCO|nr:CIC11C00000003132 [[Candida] intermedia]